MEDLKKLRIQGSNILLVEMPMNRWTEFIIRELLELSFMHDFQIVLAHVERYWRLETRSCWSRLLERGILFQANASCFKTFSSKQKAGSYLQNGRIHLLGSDCHNLDTRRPKLGDAFAWIEKKFGSDYLRQMNGLGRSLLGKL